MSDHDRQRNGPADLAEGDVLLSLFAPRALEKKAFPVPPAGAGKPLVPGTHMLDVPGPQGQANTFGNMNPLHGHTATLRTQGNAQTLYDATGIPAVLGGAKPGPPNVLESLQKPQEGFAPDAPKPGMPELQTGGESVSADQPSWLQRNQGTLALGGLGAAGVLGGGTLAYYRNEQDKKRKKKELEEQAALEGGGAQAPVKEAQDGATFRAVGAVARTEEYDT